MDEEKIPRKVVKPAGRAAKTKANRFMVCPVCGVWFDMQKLGDAFEHMHDGRKVELTSTDPTAMKPPRSLP